MNHNSSQKFQLFEFLIGQKDQKYKKLHEIVGILQELWQISVSKTKSNTIFFRK